MKLTLVKSAIALQLLFLSAVSETEAAECAVLEQFNIGDFQLGSRQTERYDAVFSMMFGKPLSRFTDADFDVAVSEFSRCAALSKEELYLNYTTPRSAPAAIAEVFSKYKAQHTAQASEQNDELLADSLKARLNVIYDRWPKGPNNFRTELPQDQIEQIRAVMTEAGSIVSQGYRQDVLDAAEELLKTNRNITEQKALDIRKNAENEVMIARQKADAANRPPDPAALVPYFSLYILGAYCAKNDVAFTATDMEKFTAELKKLVEGSGIDKSQRDRVWSSVQTSFASSSQSFTRKDCISARQQVALVLPQAFQVTEPSPF